MTDDYAEEHPTAQDAIDAPPVDEVFVDPLRLPPVQNSPSQAIGCEPEGQDGRRVGSQTAGAEAGVVPYSVFRPWQKWVIVALSSVATLLSPLSSNVYFPAIPIMADAFHVSVELINVTVTVYLILLGIAPMLWASLADSPLCGRRPVYLMSLLLLCLSCVGLALTPTNDYWLLVLLRCIQAAGSSSVMALGAGTIMDIAASHERGTFMGVGSIGPMVGPCVGPIAGGLLAGNLGWRSIFWFLCILSGVVAVFEFVLLPETLRAIVGDGSIPAQPWNRPIVRFTGKGKRDPTKAKLTPEQSEESHTPWDIIKSFRNPDLRLILISASIPFSVFYCVMATTPTLFLAAHPSLTETDLGVCYLANGIGSLTGAVTCGRLLDWQWSRAQKRVQLSSESNAEKGHRQPIDHINIPATRLQSTPYYFALFAGIIVAYGWCAQAKVHLAVLLLLQFFSGGATTSLFTIYQTLLLDLFPGRGASVTASNNLIRCCLGAVLISIIDYVLDGVGAGWTFTILAGAVVLSFPLLICEWRWGQQWLEQRKESEERHL